MIVDTSKTETPFKIGTFSGTATKKQTDSNGPSTTGGNLFVCVPMGNLRLLPNTFEECTAGEG